MTFGHRFDLVHLPLSLLFVSWSALIAVFCGWNIVIFHEHSPTWFSYPFTQARRAELVR